MMQILQSAISRAAFPVALAALWLQAAWSQPVDIRVHDPVMIRQDGVYYLFCTGRGLSVFSSTDRKTWERKPAVFEAAPEWTTRLFPNFRNSEWAPDITHHNGVYYLYYSVSSFGSNNSAIGVATNTTLNPDDPAFKWVDHGPVVRSVAGRDMWNAIDPNLAFDDTGVPWLSFGSFWLGIKLVRLHESLTEVAQPEEWYTIAARFRDWKLEERDAGDSLNSTIEAPFIFKKNGFYYLFVSWDRCCRGRDSTYKVVAGRSEKISGPYLDKEGHDMRIGGGTLVVGGNSRWPGVGHNSAYTFDGVDYLVFHGYDVNDEGRSKLWIKEIEWHGKGWPRVALD